MPPTLPSDCWGIFKDKLSKASHDPALTAEDERLENLDKMTQEWYKHLFPWQAIGQE